MEKILHIQSDSKDQVYFISFSLPYLIDCQTHAHEFQAETNRIAKKIKVSLVPVNEFEDIV